MWSSPVLTASYTQWTGSAYTSNAVVPTSSFKVTKGVPKLFDITAASGKTNHKYFCGDCGSSLWTELDVMPGMVLIKAGGLDEGGANLGNKIDVEFYCKDRVGYLGSAEGAKQDMKFG